MCGIISVSEYREDYQEQIKLEYTNQANGQEGLVVESWKGGPVYAIESEDGQQYTSHYKGSYEQKLIEAHERMTSLGFTLKGQEPRVQGKTIAEWKVEGELNTLRDPENHVHPRPTDLETEAYIASLTPDEAIVALIDAMGDMMAAGQEGDVASALTSAAS